ncbi:MAG: transposase [Bacteroidales bacterium]|nr:transposase [Bacteroidales bacterium]
MITDILNLRAEMIAAMYRRRWDIEVFFRFIRQELNFSHFISMNTDGIQITLYMTLTVAMLLMIYRQANGTGFRTAKRRMKIELQELIIAIAVVRSGGDLSKLNLPPP